MFPARFVSFSLGNSHAAIAVSLLSALSLTGVCAASSLAQETFPFGTQELPTRLQVGYAVRLIDMNDDERLDICIVDSKRILWLENPNWNEHVLVSTPDKTDNVCFAPADIDGDGRLDFAVGADWTVNTTEGGTIGWISQSTPEASSKENVLSPLDRWHSYDIGTEPTVHRMRFANIDDDPQPELIVLPLMGRNSTRPDFAEQGVRVLAYDIPEDPFRDVWTPHVINEELHVTHNFWPCDFDHDGDTELLIVSFEGVHVLDRLHDGHWKRTRVGDGNQEARPNRGASEVKLGSIRGNESFIATIEPWHGNQVVIYRQPETSPQADSDQWLWTRQVIDEQLKWGHAVWCTNLDADEEDELIIGVRDTLDDETPCGVRIYDLDRDSGQWQRSLIDPAGVAVEDLAAADLNGDGKTDIVAVGRQTHNIKIYWNEQK